VEYIHGDIYNFIKEHPNTTFITASTKSIDVMRTVNTPVCLVVCDDYQYTIEHMTKNKIDKELSDKSNIILRYTSIVSGGII
jgi:hypothetical protein